MSNIQDIILNSINNISRREINNLSNSLRNNNFRDILQSFITTAVSIQSSSNKWKPDIDIVDNKDNVIIFIEIPGVTGNDIELEFENQYLYIKAYKIPSYSYSNSNNSSNRINNPIIKKEIKYGTFERKISLPVCVNNKENIKAKYRQGILHVIINKRENNKKIKISISNENKEL